MVVKWGLGVGLGGCGVMVRWDWVWGRVVGFWDEGVWGSLRRIERRYS